MKWFPDFTPIRSAGPMGQVGQADLEDLTDFLSLTGVTEGTKLSLFSKYSDRIYWIIRILLLFFYQFPDETDKT